ncbi:anthranilate phosphoribosyltransferase [Desulfolithobacter dissulfuricans]|uniref:Anthranilate phosphoribosyltransferase n=1 Tax=Desulfolithobacter dissulfuricans TaxID=2795293 RepID=A0A915TZA4_9BACT|nr:anthranilate phosphoribosyltransferase [Desulfolithobacter dissulfuricans]BCO08581.1 anthranilate phosphoribosyltransferase [Desulfolithobacter dissulfuricans]
MIREAIAQVVTGKDLDEQQMVEVMNEIMGGEATEAQIGAFITALRMKGETIDEIVGAVRVMREKATFVDTGIDTTTQTLMDIVGTGGDGSGTFNVSTTTAFVVAAAGIPVAKHGNRAISSSCGSADVLEALGVDLSMPAERVGQCVREVGIGFLFAPMLHGAMKYAIGPRREIGIRTIFNILGPMTNPAGANVQLTGVFDRELTEVLARVLARLGMKRTLVVWGEGNMDEMTVTGTSYVADARDGEVTTYTVEPEDVGLDRHSVDDIRGGATVEESADQVRLVLDGTPGARLDMVLLNSGAALMAAGRADDLEAGVRLAREVISSGAAREKLDRLVAFCQDQVKR